nr:3-oxoacyl-[acyl-carrier-protein] reductase [uncultured Bacillus sp.]
MRLKDKVAIITGASGGIGEVTAKKFILEGAKVVIVDLKQGEVDRTVLDIQRLGGEAIGFEADVTKREQVEQFINDTVAQFGRVDVVINNAGITQDAQLVKMTEEQWDRVIDVNLKGVFNVGQSAAKIMIEQQSGVILNASSVVGLYGNFGQTNYAASKFGINGMTKTWARELGKYGIRVNAIAPGFIATAMTKKMPEKVLEIMKNKSPLKRMGHPEDIANGYAYLASDEASFITGAVISIDGGAVI